MGVETKKWMAQQELNRNQGWVGWVENKQGTLDNHMRRTARAAGSYHSAAEGSHHTVAEPIAVAQGHSSFVEGDRSLA